MTEAERAENENARLLPMIQGEPSPTGEYALRPCIIIGSRNGAFPATEVYVYLSDGRLHVEIYPDDNDPLPVHVELNEEEIYDG